MAQTQSGFVEVDGGGIYYETAGEGDTLLFGHAGFVDGGMWDSQWAAFAEHYRVIRFDMRGYGQSSPVEAPVNRRHDVLRLMNALGVERAHLLGCSMSGEIFMDFALEHPERVRSLISVSATPSGFEMQGEPPPYLMEMFEAAQAGDVKRASELQIRIWVDGMFREPAEVKAEVREQAAVMNRIAVQKGTFLKADAHAFEPLEPPATGRLADIRVPALVIDGALDHPEILRAADVMVAGIPGARKVIIPGAAHLPNMEQPDLFNRAVLDFLRGIQH